MASASASARPGNQTARDCGSYCPPPSNCGYERAAPVSDVDIAVLPWYCIQCHPQQETVALRHLDQQGIKTFLPTLVKMSGSVLRPKVVRQPLFPGYMFASFYLCESWQRIFNTQGVKHLFRSSAGAPMVISTMDMQRIQEQSMNGDQSMVAGDAARIMSGPWQGQRGTFQHMTRQQRVVILISMLGKEMRLAFDHAQVLKA
jgi:transcriptional antiterminator RfaH